MSTKSGMRRRTRITLALAVLTTAAFGAAYGLVAQQGVPQQPTTTAAATQTISQGSASAPAQSSGSSVAPSNSSRSRAVAPRVVHARTRAT
jgi:hypothetical protein